MKIYIKNGKRYTPYRHITEFDVSANTIRQRIFRKLKKGNKVDRITLKGGSYFPVINFKKETQP